MAESKPSWIDYTNLVLGVIVGGIGIGVAVLISRSADRLSANNLMVATATFLLDDSEKRRRAGIEIYTDMKADQLLLPAWGDTFISHFLSAASAPPQSEPATVRAAPEAVNETINRDTASELFSALAGTTPRMFIEIADDSQRPGAEALRRAMTQVQLAGQTVIAPQVEKVASPPNHLELRVLKAADRDEANQLATALAALLGASVPVADLSSRFDARSDVKRRTYELWFPQGAAVTVRPSKQ